MILAVQLQGTRYRHGLFLSQVLWGIVVLGSDQQHQRPGRDIPL